MLAPSDNPPFTGTLRRVPEGMGVALLYMGLPGSYAHAVRVAVAGQDFAGAGILGAVQVPFPRARPLSRVRGHRRLG
jgi:hypothetical protein